MRGCLKVRGGRDGGSSSLSRRVRREFPHLTSPQTNSASRQLLSEIRRKLDLRVPRRPRTFARLVRNRTTSKVSYHAPLYGYAFSRIKSTPHHHSHALRRHARATPVTRASKPATLINNHRTPKSPSFLTRLRNHIPFDARLVSRWLGFFRQAGQRLAVLCRAERPRNRPRAIFRSS